MKEKLKIAGVQMEPKILEKDRNLTTCLELIQATAREDARLIVFPECALTGYVFASLEEALPLCEPIPGPSTDNPWRVPGTECVCGDRLVGKGRWQMLQCSGSSGS